MVCTQEGARCAVVPQQKGLPMRRMQLRGIWAAVPTAASGQHWATLMGTLFSPTHQLCCNP